MNEVPQQNEILRYLRVLSRLSEDKPTVSVETTRIQDSIGNREQGYADIELTAKSFEFIKEDGQLRGNIFITPEGIQFIRQNNNFNRLIINLKKRTAPFLSFFWEPNRTTIISTAILLLIYLVIEPFLIRLLNTYWIDPIVSLFKPQPFFAIIFVSLAMYVIYLNRSQKFRTLDLLLLVLYCRYRFFSSLWHFTPIISSLKNGIAYTDVILFYYAVILGMIIRSKFIKPKKLFEDGYLYPDLPLNEQVLKNGKSIRELDAEGLDRNKFALQISTVIERMKPFKAFTIGVSGPWGSGKSSLLALVESNLKESRKADRYKIIWFSPWLFKNSEMLIANFFSLLEQHFSDNKGLANQIKTYGKDIALIEKSVLKTEFAGLLFEENVSLKERYDFIKAQIQEENTMLIIFIDDLDRLARKEIVQMFRLIRIIADFPNTFYLVAYDRSYVTAAIKEILTKYEPGKYLDKIFNVEFKIPEVRSNIIVSRLKTALDQRIQSLGNSIGKINEDDYKNCFEFNDLTKIIKNERDIIRFTNNLMIRYMVIKGEVNFYHFFLLELIDYHAPIVTSLIYEKRGQIINTTLSEKDEFAKLLEEVAPDDETLNAVIALFSFTPAPFGIRSDLYFSRYFSLNLLSGELTNEQFDSALQLPLDGLKKQLVEFHLKNSSLLKEKLLALRFDFSSTSADEVDKLIDGFLFFYNELFSQKNVDPSGVNEVNKLDVANTVYKLLKNKEGIDNQVNHLAERMMQYDKSYYPAFSDLAQRESVSQYTSNVKERDQVSLAFRNTNYLMLKKLIEIAGQNFDTDILRQMQEIHRFVRMTNKYDPDDETWYLENVVAQHREYYRSVLMQIIEHIKKTILQGIHPPAVSSFVQNTFHKPEYLYAYHGEFNYDIDTLIQWVDGFDKFDELSDFSLRFETFEEERANASIPFNQFWLYRNILPGNQSRYKIELNPLAVTQWNLYITFGDSEGIDEYKKIADRWYFRLQRSTDDKIIFSSVDVVPKDEPSEFVIKNPILTIQVTNKISDNYDLEISDETGKVFERSMITGKKFFALIVQDGNFSNAIRNISAYKLIGHAKQ